MIKTILWDFDNTLLDFDKAEKNALLFAAKKLNLPFFTDEMLCEYRKINTSYWLQIEKKEISKEVALVKRFEDFLKKRCFDFKCAKEYNELYEKALGDTIVYIDDSYNIVKSLKTKCKQYLVSNGVKFVQELRLKKSGFDKLFDGIFLSDIVGFEKPNIEFFDKVFKAIEPCNKNQIMIVGDSLTSDIKGGNNAKIKTCWFNPHNKANTIDVKVDFWIENLHEIFDIIN